MRLLNIQTMKMEEYYDEAVPHYAILSHRWGDEEVSLQEWNRIGEIEAKMNTVTTHCAYKNPRHDNDYYHESLHDQYSELEAEKAAIKGKSGYSKIVSCAESVQKYKYHYGVKEYEYVSFVWIDTCCIDKTNNAELSEAINSMFKWYKQAILCIVYLADVSTGLGTEEMEESVRASSWFRRGWTLQELLAPEDVEFFDQEWVSLFKKSDRADIIQSITGIDKDILDGSRQLSDACTAKKMSWAAGRVTTRQEDVAYCLLGIFDVNMPLLYGEGSRAFERLQEEIIKHSGDLSIFAWGFNTRTIRDDQGIFAYSPEDFSGCSKLKSQRYSSNMSVISTTNITHNVLLDYYVPNTARPIFIYADLNCYVKKDFQGLFLPLVRHKRDWDSSGEDEGQFDSKRHVGDVTRFWFHRPSGLRPIFITEFYPQQKNASETSWVKERHIVSVLKSVTPRYFRDELNFRIPSSQIIVEEVYPPHFCRTATSLNFGNISERQVWYPGAMEDRMKTGKQDSVAYIKFAHRRDGILTRLVIIIRCFEPPSLGEEHIYKVDLVKWRSSICASLADFELSHILQRRNIGGLQALKNKGEGGYIGDFVVKQESNKFITVKHRADEEVNSGRRPCMDSKSSSEDEPLIRTLEMPIQDESTQGFFQQ